MKKMLFILCLTHTLTVFCQLQKMGAKAHLFVNLGTICHTNKTISENNKIKGLPTFDVSRSLRLLYFFENHKTALSFGVTRNKFSTKFRTYSGYNRRFFNEKSRFSGSHYDKIDLNYHYFISLSKKTRLGAYIGTSYSRQQEKGMDGRGASEFGELDTNGVVVRTVRQEYEGETLVQYSLGGQVGCSLNCRFMKESLFSLTMGYHFGFMDVNRVDVQLFVDGIKVDNAAIYSKQSGISMSIGFSIPLQ